MAKELSDFQKAFAAARKAQGAGGTFEYKGKKFSTRRADDKDVTVSASKKFPNKENYKSDAKADADDADTLKRVARANPQIAGTAPFRRKEIDAGDMPSPRIRTTREDLRAKNPLGGFKKGGKVVNMARGGGVESKGKTKGRVV